MVRRCSVRLVARVAVFQPVTLESVWDMGVCSFLELPFTNIVYIRELARTMPFSIALEDLGRQHASIDRISRFPRWILRRSQQCLAVRSTCREYLLEEHARLLEERALHPESDSEDSEFFYRAPEVRRLSDLPNTPDTP